jgi:hypothetical protein
MSSSSPSITPGTRVRLRHRPDNTGQVIGLGLQPGDVQVRWDATDEITSINVAQLEVLSKFRLVE